MFDNNHAWIWLPCDPHDTTTVVLRPSAPSNNCADERGAESAETDEFTATREAAQTLHLDDSSRLITALLYAKGGWAVFPWRWKGPLTPYGFKDATPNELTVRTWWPQFPISTLTNDPGIISNLVRYLSHRCDIKD